MPVHRIPGAGRGSVYALTEELDIWLEADKASDPETWTDPAPKAGASSSWLPSFLRIGLPVVIIIALLGIVMISKSEAEPAGVVLPADKAVSALYLDARADWAERSPASILRAIDKLQEVVAKDPGFAPAYAALADCFVLAREFGSFADSEAFAKALSATDASLRIDPDHPGALRAKGFIEYWWRQDRKSAGEYFRRSLALEPESAQTHFWYGNVLIDNGDIETGMAALDRARLLEPASVTIQVDLAWAMWSAGDTARARDVLETLRDRHPSLATIRDYLSILYLAEGDLAGFVAENSAEAAIRGEPVSIGEAERLAAAYSGDREAFLSVLLEETLREVQAGSGQTLVWPAFVASSVGKRDALVKLLKTADASGEKWGSAGMVLQIRQRWKSDKQVIAMLNRRIPGPMI
jgi:tetratricopeptide (TPR) repeat protein